MDTRKTTESKQLPPLLIPDLYAIECIDFDRCFYASDGVYDSFNIYGSHAIAEKKARGCGYAARVVPVSVIPRTEASEKVEEPSTVIHQVEDGPCRVALQDLLDALNFNTPPREDAKMFDRLAEGDENRVSVNVRFDHHQAQRVLRAVEAAKVSLSPPDKADHVAKELPASEVKLLRDRAMSLWSTLRELVDATECEIPLAGGFTSLVIQSALRRAHAELEPEA